MSNKPKNFVTGDATLQRAPFTAENVQEKDGKIVGQVSPKAPTAATNNKSQPKPPATGAKR